MIPDRIVTQALCSIPLAVVGLTACDAHTDDSYGGEVLFSLQGNVVNHLAAAPADANVYLVWTAPQPSTPVFIAETLKLRPTFPVTFSLDVRTAPPVDPRVGFNFGILAAAEDGANFDKILLERPTVNGQGILGFDPRHMLVYVEHDVTDDNVLAGLLHSTPSAGFHMYDIKCISKATASQIDACVAAQREMQPAPDPLTIQRVCGALSGSVPWLQPAPADLASQLTVEMMDNVGTYQPDPADCI